VVASIAGASTGAPGAEARPAGTASAAVPAPAHAPPTIETVAGGVAPTASATEAVLSPRALTATATHVFVADQYDHVVRRFDRTTGAGSLVAGTGADGAAGDGGPATAAALGEVVDIAVDGAGSVFLSGGGRIRRVAPDGTITTVIGGGTTDPVEGSAALGTTLGKGAIVATGIDDLLVLEPARFVPPGGPTLPGRVWRVGSDGLLHLVAGSLTALSGGDFGPATEARLSSPVDLAVDPSSRILILDRGAQRLRRVGLDGIITTIAGAGTGAPGNGGPALSATLTFPTYVSVDADGAIAISEAGAGNSDRVRLIDASGTISQVAGGGADYPGTGGPATSAFLRTISGLQLLGPGDVIFGGSTSALRRTPAGLLTNYAGATDRFPADGQPALDVQLDFQRGNLDDERGDMVLTTDPAGVVHGAGFSIQGGTFHDERAFGRLIGFDAGGLRYERDANGNVSVRAPDRTEIRTVGLPIGSTVGAVAVSSLGDVYIASGEPRCGPFFGCSGASEVWRDPNPDVPSRPPLPAVGGNYQISGLAVDGAGGVVTVTGSCAVTEVAQPCPQRVAHVDAVGASLGTGGIPVNSYGLITRAVGVDAGGAVYFGMAHQVWKIPAGGVPEVVAGTGAVGFSGDGGPALEATFGTIGAVTVAPDGSLYVADGRRIRRIDTSTPPAAPRALELRGTAGAVRASWQAPLLTGGAPITGYELTVTVGSAPPLETVHVVPASQTTFDITDVPRGTSVAVRVRTLTASNESIDAEATIREGSGFRPMQPQRVLDSRTATGGWGGTLRSDTPRTLPIAGTAGVPADASAVVMNVTATGASLGSFLTAWPTDVAKPNVSNLNFAAGETIANLVTVKLSPSGSVSFANAVGTVDVVVDVVGYYDGGHPGPEWAGVSDQHTSVTPTRLLDSRTATGGWNGKLYVFVPRKLAVRGVGPVSSTATAVVANVTATNATVGSFLTIWPTGYAKPNASSVNFAPGQTIPNLVVSMIGSDGTISIDNAKGAVDVVVDVVGYFDPNGTSRFYPITPNRVLDSRVGVGLSGPFGPDASRALTVEDTPQVPADIDAIVANVTATEATLGSFVAVCPDGQPRNSSNLNFGVGQTIPNLTVTGVSADGKIRLYNANGSVHLIADAVGYYASAPPPPP
jgi:hypothetical protein